MNFVFWHEILLVAQTGMAHLRFDLFCNEQRQEMHANWNFLVILDFQRKAQMGEGEWVGEGLGWVGKGLGPFNDPFPIEVS